MPSPIGHAIAGLAIGFAGDPDVPQAEQGDHASPWPWRFVFLAALFAVLPDFDLALPKGTHRSFTHSFVAVAFIFSITMLMTGEVTAKVRRRIALMLAAAYASHLLLDYLGVDRSDPAGMQLLWPFSHASYLSGWDLFPPTERNFLNPAIWAIDLRALLSELMLTPIALGAWWVRRRRKSRDRPFVRDAQPPPFGAATGTDGISDRQTPRGER